MKPKPRGSKSPEDFSLGESSPMGVGRGRAAVSQRRVKVFLWSRFLRLVLLIILLILLHLQPAGSTWRQPEIQSHRVSSVRVPAPLLLLVGSVLAGGEHLCSNIYYICIYYINRMNPSHENPKNPIRRS